MKVVITDTKSGKIAASIPIVERGLNYTPTQQDYFDEAWKAAVDDKDVDPTRKNEYHFELNSE